MKLQKDFTQLSLADLIDLLQERKPNLTVKHCPICRAYMRVVSTSAFEHQQVQEHTHCVECGFEAPVEHSTLH